MRLAYDIETNGFLDQLDTIHTITIKDLDTGRFWSCADQPGYVLIDEGLRLLEAAELRVAHNGLKFDEPAIRKVKPWWSPRGRLEDTLVIARVVLPDIKDTDAALVESGRLPGKLFGRYSLEAFGYRLGNLKGEYRGGWDVWSREMQDYGEQDGHVQFDLWWDLQAKMEEQRKATGGAAWSGDAIELEHRVAAIIDRQERHGVLFDMEKAQRLYAILIQRRADLFRELKATFKPWWAPRGKDQHNRTCRLWRESEHGGVVTKRPKSKHKPARVERGHFEACSEGAEFTRIALTEFNPKSAHHIANRLQKVRGWKPKEFNKGNGLPKIDDEIIRSLPCPEAPLLSEFLMVQKRIAALAEGKEGGKAWIKAVAADGRIHGTVLSNGAVTGRMTHNSPNMANVPGLTDKKTGEPMPYGRECRELFIVASGKKKVGCDADALELRCLAGFMALYDGGAYIETVLRGDKSRGTDMHSVTARLLGISRETAKTWFYAFIYGAQDYKLGSILGAKGPKERILGAGRASREKFLRGLPALGTITSQVQQRVKSRGCLVGIDKRYLRVRSGHAALNTLLQSAGAVFMKRALVLLDDRLQVEMGLTPGVHYEFVLNVHDEWQLEVDEERAEEVGKAAADAIRRAGEFYAFRCPLAGNYVIGRNWAETH